MNGKRHVFAIFFSSSEKLGFMLRLTWPPFLVLGLNLTVVLKLDLTVELARLSGVMDE
jgi:hypothetical protein